MGRFTHLRTLNTVALALLVTAAIPLHADAAVARDPAVKPAERTIATTAAKTAAQPKAAADVADPRGVLGAEKGTFLGIVDLSVDKSDSVDPVAAGGTLVYTLLFANAASAPNEADDPFAVDVLPPGTTFVSASPGCSYDAGDHAVECVLPDLAPGASTSRTITVTAPTDGGAIVNVVRVDSDEFFDSDGRNNGDFETTFVIGSADLSISKSDSPDPVAAGGALTYTLAVSNAGPSTAATPTITDTLPAGTTFVSASPGCMYAAGPHEVTCTLPNLAPGASTSRVINVTAPGSGGAITNTASVSSSTGDPDPGNNSDSETTTVTANADLSIDKTDSPTDPVDANGPITYTLTVTNNGPSTAVNVLVVDDLPPGTTFVSATPPADCTYLAGPHDVECATASLAPSGTTSFTITINAPADGGVITNTATVSSSTGDANPANNTDTETTTVNGSADLDLNKTDSADPVAAGATFSYSLPLTNNGPSTAVNPVIVDTLPAGVTFVSASPGCAYAAGPHTVTCTLANLPAGGMVTVTITVQAPNDAGTIFNTATASSDTADPDGTNNDGAEFTTITGVADLSLDKTDSPDPVAPGGTLTYTVTVSNAGPSTAVTPTVTDTLPAGTTFVSASPGCSEAGGVVTCMLADIAPGDSTSVTITVTAPGVIGTISNTASVSSPSADPDGSNNSDTEQTTVSSADLSLAKSDGPDPVVAGGPLTYALFITNAGPSTADDPVVVDTLPPGTTFVSAPAGCAYAPGPHTVTCTLSDLVAPSFTGLTITVNAPAEGGLICNFASVSAATPDPDASNNADTECTIVDGSADLSIVKSDSPDPVIAGGTLTYTLTVSNAGPSTAATPTITDTLPAGTTFVSASPGCSELGGTVTCSLANIPPGGSSAVTITVTAPLADGLITNTASVTSSTADPDGSNNSDSEDTTVSPNADLGIVKSDSPDPVDAGAPLTYTLTVTNNGPSTATTPTITDALPAGTTFVSASPGCTHSSGTVTCSLASIPFPGSAVVTINVTAPLSGGIITNTASVSSSTPDPDASNNTDSEPTTVGAVADLSLAKTDSPDPVDTDGTLTYTITVSNAGPSAAASPTVTDTLPAGTTFVSASAGCTHSAGTVTCSLADIPAGGNAVVTITVTAPSSSGVITNSASVSSPTPDPDGTNNSDTESTTVVPAQADLSLTKTASPTNAFAGQTVTYTITVSNAGPSAAQDVVMSDTVPAEMTFQSASPSQGACAFNMGVVLCQLGDMPAGSSATITITVEATDDGVVVNTASAGSPTNDPDTSNNTDSATVVVQPLVDLVVQKTDSPDPVDVGEELTYTITVTNVSSFTATGVTVTDPLPANYTFTSATPSQGACAFMSGTVTCSLGTIPGGGVATVTIKGTPTATGTMTNSASADSNEEDAHPGNNDASEVTTVAGDTEAPTVTLTRPEEGTIYVGSDELPGVPGFAVIVTPLDTFELQATASDDASVAEVRFLIGSTVLCTDTTAPYACEWTPFPSVLESVSAVAVDTSGNVSAPSSADVLVAL